MCHTILIWLKVNSKENSREFKNIKSSCKDGVKPRMFSKSSNPSSDKGVSENRSGAVKGTSAKCRFCSSPDNTTIYCDVYLSVEASVSLADQKGWCTPCLSGKHLLDKCPGKSSSLPFKCYKCKKSEHHAAVCPSSKNFAGKSFKGSFNYQSNPVLSFTVSRGKSRANLCFC